MTNKIDLEKKEAPSDLVLGIAVSAVISAVIFGLWYITTSLVTNTKTSRLEDIAIVASKDSTEGSSLISNQMVFGLPIWSGDKYKTTFKTKNKVFGVDNKDFYDKFNVGDSVYIVYEKESSFDGSISYELIDAKKIKH